MFNEYQSSFESLGLDGYPSEVVGWLKEAVVGIPFVQWLVSKDRPRAKDLERRDGRIVVDLVKPHILEDMEYFIQARRHFEEHGCYTFLRPNKNVTSEYYKWLKTEMTRCLDGMVRESDGEWIPGTLYFQLNYAPMMVNKAIEGSNASHRIESFPDLWEGLYWRHHYVHQARFGGKYNNFAGGNHAAELSRRGSGKSYSLAAMMASRLLVGESLEVQKRVITILTAYLSEYLSSKDGTFTKFTPILDHCAEHTQFKRSKLKDSPSEMSWIMGYKDKTTGAAMGSKNNVSGVSTKDNEGKLRGKRGYIFFEEFGSFPNLLQVYNNVRYSVEEGNSVFALLYLIGTAGDSKSDFYSAQELIYQPLGYNIYALPNVYDVPGKSKEWFSFFFPAYINRAGCYNKDGVSDVTKALLEIFMSRYVAKYQTTDPTTLSRVIAEIPITPDDAIQKVDGGIFPTQDLAEHLITIDTDKNFYDTTLQGSFVITPAGEVDFRPGTDRAIREFPIKEMTKGAVEVYEMPVKGSNGKPMPNRYIIGVDPYEADQSRDTVSLGSCVCMDLFTDRVVCEYTGRPQFVDDFFEICRRMALYYGCRINYENNKKGMYAYFKKMNSLHLLEDTLEYLKDKQIVKTTSFGNSGKGIPASVPVNKFARTLLADWLCKPVNKKVYRPDGSESEVTMLNLHGLRGRAMVQELMLWNTNGNFDRVSSMMMLMLYREDFMVRYGGNIEERVEVPKNRLSKDSFFEKNYRANRGNKSFGKQYGFIGPDGIDAK